MEQKELDEMIKRTEDEMGSKFKDLFNEEQQKDILEMLKSLDDKIKNHIQ